MHLATLRFHGDGGSDIRNWAGSLHSVHNHSLNFRGIVGSVGPTEDQERRAMLRSALEEFRGSSGRGPIKEITVIPGGDCHDGVAPGGGGAAVRRAPHPAWGALADQETPGPNQEKLLGGVGGATGYRRSVQAEGTAWQASPVSRARQIRPTRDHPLSRGPPSIKAGPGH